MNSKNPNISFVRLTTIDSPHYIKAMEVYRESFPSYEQRTDEKQQSLMSESSYHFDVVLDRGEAIGILLHWNLGKYEYIEHFAIESASRGQSLGSRCLQAFCEKEAVVILEIDPPVDDITIRRQHFYEKCGFFLNQHQHAHPAYHRENPPHNTMVMSIPKVLTEAEYQRFCSDLGNIVMADVP